VELLKQGQYVPMPVEKQVVSIFAGTNGYIDDVPVADVRRFESELLEMMELKHASLLSDIAVKKELNEDIQGRLQKVVGDFAASFKKS